MGRGRQSWQVKGQLSWDAVGHYEPNREAVQEGPGAREEAVRGEALKGTLGVIKLGHPQKDVSHPFPTPTRPWLLLLLPVRAQKWRWSMVSKD